MTQANDSFLSAPDGSGTSVATHLVNSKEYQVTMPAGDDGHIYGSKPFYCYTIASQVHVAAANTIHFDMFNADPSIVVRVVSIRQIPNITTAVTGVVFDWQLFRTSAVGTGGTAQTAWLPDTAAAALDADITCRSKPTGGATTSGNSLFNYSIHSEETNAATIQLASMGGLELLPLFPMVYPMEGIKLGQNQGLKVVQVTNSAAGNTGWRILFTAS
jgi:hypothetical protein